jgi:predicted Zn-dependent protease
MLVSAQESEEAALQLNRAISLIEKGKIDEAIGELQRIIEENPNYAPAYANLGSAFYRKGKLDKSKFR